MQLAKLLFSIVKASLLDDMANLRKNESGFGTLVLNVITHKVTDVYLVYNIYIVVSPQFIQATGSCTEQAIYVYMGI